MKPLGLRILGDGGMVVVRPNEIQDQIWETVSKALNAGWTPEMFRQEAASCWSEYLRQKREDDDKAWRKP